MCDIAPICGRNVCFCTFVYFLRFVFCFHESVLYLWDLVFYLRDSFYICVIRFLFVRLSFLFVRLLLYLCDSLYVCAIRFVFVRFVLYLCVAVVGHRTDDHLPPQIKHFHTVHMLMAEVYSDPRSFISTIDHKGHKQYYLLD